MNMLIQLLLEHLPLLIAGVLAAFAARFLCERVRSERMRRVLYALNESVCAAVASTEQTYVSEIKKTRRSGRLLSEEKTHAKRAALREAKRLLGSRLLGELRALFGANEDNLLSTYVEAEVATRKAGL